MNLIISGPQGSGKGTQAELLAKKLGLVHLETGQMFRRMAEQKTSLGRKIAILLKGGKIIPDQLTLNLVSPFLTQKNLDKGIIFDGFPRRLSQIKWLDKKTAERGDQIDKLLFLKISQEESIRRLSSRRICPQCGRNFNLITMPPKKDELCDDCQIKLITRSDETPEAIKKRLKEYHNETDPMIDYYRPKGKVIEINGEQPPQKVFKDILKALE